MRSFLRDVGGGLAENERLAFGGEQQAEQELDGRGLARAVGPEQAEDLALADLEVEGAEGRLLLPAPEVAIDFGELVCLDDHVVGHVATLGAALGPRSDDRGHEWAASVITQTAKEAFALPLTHRTRLHFVFPAV